MEALHGHFAFLHHWNLRHRVRRWRADVRIYDRYRGWFVMGRLHWPSFSAGVFASVIGFLLGASVWLVVFA